VPKSRFVLGMLLYALFIAYGSTVIGPMGLHYVPIGPDEALRRFVAHMDIWIDNGSDQRPDWMANLLMLVPLGFLVAGSLWPERRGMLRPAAAIAALTICCGFILSVKYAQLFFPPRTVTLNYAVAQISGAVAGIILVAVCHGRLASIARGFAGGPLESLTTLLQIYTAALLLFLLMPLDFALSADDVRAQIERMPDIIVTVTGAGRPPLVRASLIVAGTVAMIPVGMLLTVNRKRRSLLSGAGRAWLRRSTLSASLLGFVMMAAVLFLSALLLSGAPSLVALFYRTLGIALGAALMHWLSRRNPASLRCQLAALVPWLVVPYLLLLLGANRLLSTHWRSPAEAFDTLYWLGLVPLFDWYIVSKAEAAKNIVAHAVLYAPIGVMVWLRARQGRGAGMAFLLAFPLALAVEAARYLRPGLEGDINAVAVGGASAWLTARLMPAVWWLIGSVGRPMPDGVPGWRARAAGLRTDARVRAVGEVERY
jgi:VanZ family protein